jgi:hypothetical protein
MVWTLRPQPVSPGGAGQIKAKAADLEPTDEEMKIATQMGNTRERLIVQKAREQGRKVPDALAEILAELRRYKK